MRISDRSGSPLIDLRPAKGKPLDLLLVSERIEWVGRGHEGVAVTEPLELETAAQALELFAFARSRAEEAGLKWSTEPVKIRPNAQAQEAIERSFRLGHRQDLIPALGAISPADT
ncbi:hypothetical protein AB0D22_07095 [Kitasatospora sp. NPDC048538]|uniref:hypothetical protein n=1 Tax=Kitasatospora sp. NPDC048538 TaxID=3155633 RepID=UPI0034005CDC